MTKSALVILIGSVLMTGGCSDVNSVSLKSTEDDLSLRLVYENDFSDLAPMTDWIMEGPGEFTISDGKLTMTPYAQQAMRDKWQSLGRKVLDPFGEYYPTVEKELMQSGRYPHLSELYDAQGRLNGGHIVLWNSAFETAESYVVEYYFKPLSPVGLAILFFSAKGTAGQDIFAEELTGRYGVFSSYTRGDIDCYHISYWANNAAVGKRSTCNFRKNAGFYNLANGSDPSVRDLDYNDTSFTFTKHRIRLEKIRDVIAFYVDGQLAFKYQDRQVNDVLDSDGNLRKENVDTGPVLGGGRIGLRQMVGLKAEYSNFKVYNVISSEQLNTMALRKQP